MAASMQEITGCHFLKAEERMREATCSSRTRRKLTDFHTILLDDIVI